MVDFRKWLMAFAGAALLFGLGSSANAQSTAFICNATAGNPHIVRSEGVAELVGDLVLNCTGGSVTPAGQNIPLTNVQISLNTNVTSRLTGGSGSLDSEAILAIDEPFPSPGNVAPINVIPNGATAVSGAATTQAACIADGLHGCDIISPGTALNFGASGAYNGIVNNLTPGPHFNLFQGIINPVIPNQVNWQGVPIDAPGTTGTRILRITNVRANACQLTPGGSLVPTTITELIGISGSQTIIINNPLQTVALAEKGLYGSASSAAYQQCNNLNAFLLGAHGGVTGVPIGLTATEGFAAAFRSVSYTSGGSTFFYQNVLGASYNTESGFVPFPGSVPGLDESGRKIGLADTGTEVTFTVTGVGAGVSLFVPNSIPLLDPNGNPTFGIDGVTASYANLVGAGGGTIFNGGSANPPAASGSTQVTVTGTSASITYVVIVDDPNVVESLTVPMSVAFINSSSTVPATGSSSVSINFAPLSSSTQNVSSASAPIPRFCQPYGPATAFTISPCTCNLLFPFVTNIAGFDTGVAIANTTADPYGTVAQTGSVILNYYGTTSGGGAQPPAFTTDAVTGGQELIFTLSNGGNFSVPATPGFEGYIIAQANFQYCHGFAFISDVGAQKLAEGYLAINLDVPLVSVTVSPGGLNRTGNGGESQGH
jgi:hypothetical protein